MLANRHNSLNILKSGHEHHQHGGRYLPDSGSRRARVRWSAVREDGRVTRTTAVTRPWRLRSSSRVAPSARPPRSRSAAGWTRVGGVAAQRICSTTICNQHRDRVLSIPQPSQIFAVAVTALNLPTKSPYVEPGQYWNGRPSSGGHTTSVCYRAKRQNNAIGGIEVFATSAATWRVRPNITPFLILLNWPHHVKKYDVINKTGST